MDTTPFDIEDFVPTMGQRELFPALRARAYLSHAAISPLSLPVVRAMASASEAYAAQGIDAFGHGYGQRRRLKESLLGLLNAPDHELAFVANTTVGISSIALCIPWKTGERVVVFDEEFPTNVTPWLKAAEAFGLEVCVAGSHRLRDPAGPDFSEIETLLQRGVRLIAISAVQFQTGIRMPIEELARRCHRWGAEICVDAIQALGATPLDLTNIDYLSAGGHKWLMGPEGTGLLLARKDKARALRPLVAGWLSHTSPTRFLFEGPGQLRHNKPIRGKVDFVESGTLNAIGLVGLEAAITLLSRLGIHNIYTHLLTWQAKLIPSLQSRGFTVSQTADKTRRSAFLCVRPPHTMTVSGLATYLSQNGISCSTPDGWLRFAPHWPNALSECVSIIDCIDSAPLANP